MFRDLPEQFRNLLLQTARIQTPLAMQCAIRAILAHCRHCCRLSAIAANHFVLERKNPQRFSGIVIALAFAASVASSPSCGTVVIPPQFFFRFYCLRFAFSQPLCRLARTQVCTFVRVCGNLFMLGEQATAAAKHSCGWFIAHMDTHTHTLNEHNAHNNK